MHCNTTQYHTDCNSIWNTREALCLIMYINAMIDRHVTYARLYYYSE